MEIVKGRGRTKSRVQQVLLSLEEPTCFHCLEIAMREGIVEASYGTAMEGGEVSCFKLARSAEGWKLVVMFR